MANNFLIDKAQSAGTIAQDIFNKASNAYTGAKNFGSITGTFGDSLIGPNQGGWDSNLMSSGMEEEIKNQVYSDMRKYGTTSNGIGYEELGLPTRWDKTGEHPKGLGAGGLFSSKNAVALTAGKMDYSVNPQNGMFNITGGADYNFPEGIFGDNRVSTGIADWINKGGTKWNPQGIQLDPTKIQESLNEYTELRGNPLDKHITNNQTPPVVQDVGADTSEYWKAKWAGTPVNVIGTSQTALSQIEDQKKAAAEKELPPPRPTVTRNLPPPRPKPVKSSGMMSSGPKRRSSRGSRRKAVAKPSRSNYSRKYSRLVGGR